MAHTREGSLPRMPFVTPIISQKAYKEPAQQTTPRNNPIQPSSATKPAKTQAPTLNVITGFDNPRTPPAPGHGFKPVVKHTGDGSLQERRAAKATEKNGSLDVKRPVHNELSPSDGTVLIGFDHALKALNLQTSERKLNIQSHTEHLVSPIAPSIIVTGIPTEGQRMSDMFLRPVDSRHRSSIYSQHTSARPTPAQRRDSIDSAPPVPTIPHDLLGVEGSSPHYVQSSRITSWNTDFDDDDRSFTCVGSVPPVKDDLKVQLLDRRDTTATFRSQGWWNTITTPFLLQRTATLDKSFPRSPASKSSPYSTETSSSGLALSEANIAALTRENTSPALNPTTPHLADEKRQTIGFFGEATPKTATFPPVPAIPAAHQNEGMMSPEFVDPGPIGEAAKYFEACWHDLNDPEPFFPCINHDCRIWIHKDAIADARSRELFLASAAVDRANNARNISEHLESQHGSKLASVSGIVIPQHDTKSPSLADHVQPSDSVSQVAERKAAAEALTMAGAARGIPEIPKHFANRQTITSDTIGSPEVAEATAMPIMRAFTPEPTHVSETKNLPPAAAQTRAVPVVVHAPTPSAVPAPPPAPVPAHSLVPAPPAKAPSDVQAPTPKFVAPAPAAPASSAPQFPTPGPPSIAAPMPAPVSRAPYPESSGMPGAAYVPPPPPPPPMMNPYPLSPQLGHAGTSAGSHAPMARSISPAAHPGPSAASSHLGPPPPAGYVFDNHSQIGVARSMSPAAHPGPAGGSSNLYPAPPAGYRTDNSSQIGVARSVSPANHPTKITTDSHSQGDMARSMPGLVSNEHLASSYQPHHLQASHSTDSAARLGGPTVITSHNPFKRQPPPPLSVPHSPQPQDAVSPGAITPNMARQAEIGNAVPMQPAQQTSLQQAPSMAAGGATSAADKRTSAYTRRALMERYDQRNSPAKQAENRRSATVAPVFVPAHQVHSEQNRNTALPPPPASGPLFHGSDVNREGHPTPPGAAFIPGPHYGSDHDIQASRTMDEKYGADLPPRPNKKPGKLGLLIAAWKEGRKQRPKKNKTPRTKEQKKKRRRCGFILCGLFLLVLLIVLLVMFLTVPRKDIPAQSSWLNLTDYPPIPTGVATIARPNAVQEQSGCIVPETMWSCAVPRDQQDGIKPNAPNQPNFRLEIRFQNGTSMSNGTTVNNNKTAALLHRDDYTASLWNPSPAPPSEDDQIFIGNTTDHNAAPYDGEQTPFFITFLPTTVSSNQKRDIPKSSSSSSPASSSTKTPSSTSSTDYFPDLSTLIPSPAVDSAGAPCPATLYPLPTAQPLRLYNRNQPTEHYGFYTYFDRSIFLTSVTLSNGSLSSALADVPGGAALTSATQRCTFAQTRFLVQIWTGGPGERGNQNRQLINGSSMAEAAAAGNITAKSWGNFEQPGSFPYPVTVTLDRHGGEAKSKMVYCYGIEGGKVNATAKKVSLEDRAFGGVLVANPGGFFSNTTSSVGGTGDGPIDGGSGGCGCTWQNWQST